MGFAAPTVRWFNKNTLFGDSFKETLTNKSVVWDKNININCIENMLDKNMDGVGAYSLQLWVAQNIIGMV